MCYGGGNRGRAVGRDVSQFTVSPSRSFAARLASFCGQLVWSITARTDVTRPITSKVNGRVVDVYRTVGPTQSDANGNLIYAGRHQKEGDKVVFETNSLGTIESPEPASRTYFTWKP
jgi:hypothetical protein